MNVIRFLEAMGEINDDVIMEVADIMEQTNEQKNRARIHTGRRRFFRTLLIAAAIAAVLSATAFAAYSYLLSTPEQAVKAVKQEIRRWEELGIIAPQGEIEEDGIRVRKTEEPTELSAYYYHRIIRPHYQVSIRLNQGFLVCTVDMADGKLYGVTLSAYADEDDPIVGEGVEWGDFDGDGEDDIGYYRDNLDDLIPEGLTLDELCERLMEYWGFQGYMLAPTTDGFYDWQNITYSGEMPVRELWNQPYATVYFNGDQEGVPMFIELGGFCPPGHAYSALVIGTNHIVG